MLRRKSKYEFKEYSEGLIFMNEKQKKLKFKHIKDGMVLRSKITHKTYKVFDTNKGSLLLRKKPTIYMVGMENGVKYFANKDYLENLTIVKNVTPLTYHNIEELSKLEKSTREKLEEIMFGVEE